MQVFSVLVPHVFIRSGGKIILTRIKLSLGQYILEANLPSVQTLWLRSVSKTMM